MKANHNITIVMKAIKRVFINMSKIQYESKSQPNIVSTVTNGGFYQYVKDTI